MVHRVRASRGCSDAADGEAAAAGESKREFVGSVSGVQRRESSSSRDQEPNRSPLSIPLELDRPDPAPDDVLLPRHVDGPGMGFAHQAPDRGTASRRLDHGLHLTRIPFVVSYS